jgi:hypothetical protein
VKSDFQSANLSKKVCFSVICCSSRGSLLVSWSWMFGISLPSKLCCSRVSDSATSHLDAKKYHVTQRSVESPRSIIVFRISVLFCDIHSHNFSFRTQRRKRDRAPNASCQLFTTSNRLVPFYSRSAYALFLDLLTFVIASSYCEVTMKPLLF